MDIKKTDRYTVGCSVYGLLVKRELLSKRKDFSLDFV